MLEARAFFSPKGGVFADGTGCVAVRNRDELRPCAKACFQAQGHEVSP